jgi:hypothetical protein
MTAAHAGAPVMVPDLQGQNKGHRSFCSRPRRGAARFSLCLSITDARPSCRSIDRPHAASKNKTTITFTSYGEVKLMELAFIAIIIAAIVLLLQIVSLAQIAGIRKSMRIQRDSRPPQIQHGDRFDKRNQDFRRHERRPFPDQQQRPPQAAATQIDPVEKSLRDLNLRLKSAEREQESARRKIQENFPRGDHNRGRDDRNRDGRDRDGRDRDGRDRDGRDRDGRDHRGNRDRNLRRDSWQDRNRSGGFPQQPPQAVPQQPNEPLVEKKETDLPPTEIKTPVQQTGPATGQDLGASDFGSGENLEHGRKIIVKRRMLKDDVNAETSAESTSVEEAPSRAPQETTPPSFPAASFPIEHREEETKIGEPGPVSNPDDGIKFGRGRR